MFNLFGKKEKNIFPKYDDLSFEQINAINLDYVTNNLVIGAPGTGKTIVALYRLHELYKNGIKNNLMLVFNRALMDYIKNVQKGLGWEEEFNVYTVNDWCFYVLYCGSEKEPHKNGIKSKYVPNKEDNDKAIDWKKVKEDFEEDKNIYEHIVVDEGQDFPKDFFKIITNVSKNVTIYADPNQSLQKDNTSISDILDIINKETNYTLTLNYRNTRPIASFTRNYCYDKSIFAESYKESDNLKIVEKPENDEDCYNKILDIIKNYDKNTEIGIIVPSVKGESEKEKRRLTFGVYDYLTANLKNRNVEVYYNTKILNEEQKELYENIKNIDFNNKSIKIFNYMNVRGLDFDVVVVLDNISGRVNTNLTVNEVISTLNRIYVASTRAKDDLYIIPMDEESEEFVNRSNAIDTTMDFPVLRGSDKVNYYSKAKELYENGDKILALYYLHYILSIVGFDDDIELYNDAVKLFSEICEEFNKNDFAISMIINFVQKYKNNYSDELKLLYERLLKNSFKNKKKPEGNDEDENSNLQKKEIVSKIAYLIGLKKEKYLENNYDENIFNQLERNKQAKIIRTLCDLRNICYINFANIQNIMNEKPTPAIYTISKYFSNSAFTYLSGENILFSDREEHNLEEFEMRLNELIQERIGNITNLFPTFIKYQYIREMFVMPKGTKYSALKTEVNKYYENRNYYPFGLYINWKPEDAGNLLKDDHHFCHNLYYWHNDQFDENGKVSWISIEKKKAFDDFIKEHKKILIAVDCENSDPYRLIAAINDLNEDNKENIYKILLIDDDNASMAWSNLKEMINIPIEYIKAERILEQKSIVDGTLIANVTKIIYQQKIDSVILATSDSDFISLINTCNDVDYFILVEHNQFSKKYQQILESKNIKYCFIDDFDTTEADQKIEEDFKYLFVNHLNTIIGDTKINELASLILKKMRVKKNEQEQKILINKYIDDLKICIDDENVKVKIDNK